MTEPTTTPRPSIMPARTPRTGMIVALAFAGTVVSFMATLVIPIQNHLPDLLNASRDDTAWVITITLITNAVCTPIAGRLGDMYGKRRLILVLLSALVVGSVVCAMTDLLPIMLIGRALQGSCLGVIPLSISVLRESAPDARLGTSVGIISGSLGFGGAIGLPVSAAISQWWSWHVLFWTAAALGLVALAIVLLFVPADRRTGPHERLDILGAVWMAIGLVGFLVGLSRGNAWGWTSPWTLGLLFGGIALLVLWVAYELRLRSPIVDVRLLARRPVLLINVTSIFVGFAFFAGEVFYPQLLELPDDTGVGLGLDFLTTSMVLLPGGIAMMLVAPLASWMSERMGARATLAIGSATMAAGYTASVFLHSEPWHILVFYGLVGAGGGLAYAAMPVLIMQQTPMSQTAAANGLNALARTTGMMLAAAVCGVVLAADVRDVAGLPAPTAQAFEIAILISMACSAVGALLILVPQRSRRD